MSADEPVAETAAKPADGSRRIYALWTVGLGLLALLGVFCWVFLLPYLQVRAALATHRSQDYARWRPDEILQLGGSYKAMSKLKFYLRLPECLAGEKRLAFQLIDELPLDYKAKWTTTDVDLLISLLGARDGPGRDQTSLRESAALKLGFLGPAATRAVPALDKAIIDSDPRVRFQAAAALVRLCPERGIQPFLGLMADPDDDCRGWAAEQLGLRGSEAEPALPALEATVKNGRSREEALRLCRTAIWKIRGELEQDPAANRKLRAKLKRETTLDFLDTPIKQVLKRLGDEGNFEFTFAPSLDDASSPRLVTIRVSLLSYDQAIYWLTKLVGCDFAVRNGAVYVFDQKEEPK